MRRGWLWLIALWVAPLAQAGIVASYDGAVLGDSPLRYYRLGEAAGPTALDSSLTGSNGTYLNLAPSAFGQPGPLVGGANTCVLLDGLDDYVTAPDALDIRLTGDLTLEFWYRKSAEAGDWQRLVGKGNPTQRNYGVWEEAGAGTRLLFQEYNSSGGQVLGLFSNSGIPIGQWTYVAATIQGSTARIYLNSTLDAQGARTGTPGTAADPLTIGYGPGLHTYFPGNMDEVAVYNHALDPGQIRVHYNAALGLTTYPQIVANDGATAFYRYDDAGSGNGSPALDSIGAPDNGTYLGNVTLVPGYKGFPAGQAASFNGSTSYIQLPSGPFGAYPTGGSTNSYTLSFETWFNTTAGGVILGQTNNAGTPGGAGPSGYVPAIYVDTTGRLRVSMFWHNGTGNQIVSPMAYNDGRWHHLVEVYNNGIESLYVDGFQVGSQNQSEFAYSGSYFYYLGTGFAGGAWANTNGGWFFYNGLLDETAIYPVALSEGMILSHYYAGTPEPASLTLLALGGLGLLARRRRCR